MSEELNQARATAGRGASARPINARIEAFAASAGAMDPTIHARIEQARSYRAYLLEGDIETYLERMADAAESYEKVGDLRNAFYAGGDLGYAELEIGAYDDVERTLRAVIEGADRMGLSGVAAVARKNTGMAAARLGDLERAIDLESEALRMFMVQRDRRMEGGARIYLALIREARARLYDRAERIRKPAWRESFLTRVPHNARTLALAALTHPDLPLREGRGRE